MFVDLVALRPQGFGDGAADRVARQLRIEGARRIGVERGKHRLRIVVRAA